MCVRVNTAACSPTVKPSEEGKSRMCCQLTSLSPSVFMCLHNVWLCVWQTGPFYVCVCVFTIGGQRSQMRCPSALMNCDSSCQSPLPLPPPPPPPPCNSSDSFWSSNATSPPCLSFDYTNCAQNDRLVDQRCLTAAEQRAHIFSTCTLFVCHCSLILFLPLLPSMLQLCHIFIYFQHEVFFFLLLLLFFLSSLLFYRLVRLHPAPSHSFLCKVIVSVY